jgi:hypothetical protein
LSEAQSTGFTGPSVKSQRGAPSRGDALISTDRKEHYVHPTDHIQIVTFNLAGLRPDQYAAHAQTVAPRFAELSGLRSKAWIADDGTNTYGGVYV